MVVRRVTASVVEIAEEIGKLRRLSTHRRVDEHAVALARKFVAVESKILLEAVRAQNRWYGCCWRHVAEEVAGEVGTDAVELSVDSAHVEDVCSGVAVEVVRRCVRW